MSGCFEDWGDGTIRDTCTGLQWEKKTTAVGSGPDPTNLHDVDNFYTWAGCCNGDCSTIANFCQPNAAAAATCAAQASGGTQGCSVCASGTCNVNVDPYGFGASTTVWDWVNQVNTPPCFAGHCDWRLPSEQGRNLCTIGGCPPPRELETILLTPYVCGISPCIDSIFGPTAPSSTPLGYWSATTLSTFPGGPGTAINFSFGNGSVNYTIKHWGLYVRGVRSGP